LELTASQRQDLQQYRDHDPRPYVRERCAALLKIADGQSPHIVGERSEPSDEQPQGMCLDKGYDYDEVRALLVEFGFTAHIRSRGEEAKELVREAGKRARRWVVERSHSWMNRFRRILVRWEKKPEHYLAFLHFACALIAFRAAGLFG
jgi:transposase